MADGLAPRQLRVLHAVVEGYVATSEPVGSKAIAARPGLGVSAATIRNDMAALEQAGLITQPHTSAGRIPTDAGYRVFVDRLAPQKPLTEQQRRAIRGFLAGSDGFDDTLGRAGRLVAELTGQIAIVQYPPLRAATLRHLELVDLGTGTGPRAGVESGEQSRVLVIVITDAGRVSQQVVLMESEPTAEGGATNPLAELGQQLNAVGAGQPFTSLAPLFAAVAEGLAPPLARLVHEVIKVVSDDDAAGAENRLVVSGAANLARQASSAEPGILPLLEALEEQVTILRLLAEMKGEAVNGPSPLRVRIGAENRQQGLTQVAVVTAGYGREAPTDVESPVVGTLGPTRIDYPATMSTVRGVAELLTDALPV